MINICRNLHVYFSKLIFFSKSYKSQTTLFGEKINSNKNKNLKYRNYDRNKTEHSLLNHLHLHSVIWYLYSKIKNITIKIIISILNK